MARARGHSGSLLCPTRVVMVWRIGAADGTGGKGPWPRGQISRGSMPSPRVMSTLGRKGDKLRPRRVTPAVARGCRRTRRGLFAARALSRCHSVVVGHFERAGLLRLGLFCAESPLGSARECLASVLRNGPSCGIVGKDAVKRSPSSERPGARSTLSLPTPLPRLRLPDK